MLGTYSDITRDQLPLYSIESAGKPVIKTVGNWNLQLIPILFNEMTGMLVYTNNEDDEQRKNVIPDISENRL